MYSIILSLNTEKQIIKYMYTYHDLRISFQILNIIFSIRYVG